MRKFINYLLLIIFLSGFLTGAVYAQNPAGNWKFDDAGDLLKSEAGLGQALELVGSHDAVAGPAAGNGAVKIGVGSHYKMTHGIAANGGGAYVNEYSLKIDFKVAALGAWHSFFQISPTNSNDGDCFINTSGNIGVGATGYSSYAIKANEWYRLVISVKNGSHYQYYLDGQLLHSGAIQSVDGRFGLESKLLIFADEDGEDNEIYCSELAIWDYPLTAQEVKNLGGFDHQTSPQILTLVPYLQTPTPNSIWICWHDTASAPVTRIEYGATNALGQSTAGSSELIAPLYRWHSVNLTGLQPNTEYCYKAVSGSGASAVYKFRTLPDKSYTGKMRFLLLSDTHNPDTTMPVKIIKEAKKKIEQLYGGDIHNQLTAVLHSGDIVVSGNSVTEYNKLFFSPMAPLSPYAPFMVVTGNHEGENKFYYDYMKYDEVSAFAPPSSHAEKFWWFTAGNAMFIGLNTNIVAQVGALQKAWLDIKMLEAENDSSIDFVFCSFHHPPMTELWVEALSYDAGPGYVRNELFPILKKYSKVQQLTYGHTHAFERGTIESNKDGGDFRIVCGGGGGGDTDRWGEFTNLDYAQIHVSMDHYFFQIVEIDIAQKSYEVSMYSLGNSDRSRDAELMDRWHFRVNQPHPDQPEAQDVRMEDNSVVFQCSAFSGVDSLMTSHIQISTESSFNPTLIDTMVNWQNIYGDDAAFNPIDKNAGLDLTVFAFQKYRFVLDQVYFYRVRYRDRNLKWSDWSDAVMFNLSTALEQEQVLPQEYRLNQNFPNPFNPITTIAYQIPVGGHVTLEVFDSLGRVVTTLVDEYKQTGRYHVTFDGAGLSSGVYYYRINSGKFSDCKKFSLIK